MRSLRSVLRSPGVWITLVVTLALSIPVMGVRQPIAWLDALGISPQHLAEGHLWAPFTALFVAPSALALVVVLALSCVLYPIAEHMLGTWRPILIAVATGSMGMLIGAAVQLGISALDIDSAWYRLDRPVVDPIAGLAGLTMAASAAMPVLWRRRVRSGGWMFLLIMVLYSGDAQDIYRVVAALLGLGVGLVITRRGPSMHVARAAGLAGRSAAAFAVALVAVGPFVASITRVQSGALSLASGVFEHPAWPTRSHAQSIELHYDALSHVGGFACLVVLLVCAYWIRRGRALALWVAVVVLVGITALFVAALLGLPNALDVTSPAFGVVDLLTQLQILLLILGHVALVVWLIVIHRRCGVTPSRRALVTFVAGAITAFVAACLLYAIGVMVAWEQFEESPSFFEALLAAPERMLPPGVAPAPETFLPMGPLAMLVTRLFGPLFWLTVAVLLWRACGTVHRASRVDDAQLRAALQRGGDSISFMATWQGARHWTDPVSGGIVPFGVASGCAVTLGGVIGIDAEDALPVVTRFIAAQERDGLQALLYSVPSSYRPVADALGWTTIDVASESIVDLEAWSLAGKKWQSIRTAISRADREGVVATWTPYEDLTVRRAHEIAAMSDEWVSERALPEMGFTLGGVRELDDPDVRLMLAIDASGRIQAVTSWLPRWRDGRLVGYTLEFMRRAPETVNGIMEFLIASAAVRMKEEGLETMSLSGAPLAGLHEEEEREAIDTVLNFIARSLEPAYGFASLHRFKQKFQPQQRALMLCAPDAASLPMAGMALSRLYLPELTIGQLARLGRSGQEASRASTKDAATAGRGER